MGTDLIPTLLQWDEGQRLVDEVNFVIYNRVGYDIQWYLDSLSMPKKYKYKKDAKVVYGDISATEVRNRVASSKKYSNGDNSLFDLVGLVTKGIIDYIITNRLY